MKKSDDGDIPAKLIELADVLRKAAIAEGVSVHIALHNPRGDTDAEHDNDGDDPSSLMWSSAASFGPRSSIGFAISALVDAGSQLASQDYAKEASVMAAASHMVATTLGTTPKIVGQELRDTDGRVHDGTPGEGKPN